MSTTEGTIYVVEDDASFRKSIERLVRASNWEVISFETANGFLEYSPIRQPACLLLDVCLPDIDGMRLQELIEELNIRLPVIFMTAHGNIPMGVEAMKKGAVDFLPKPFKPEELLRAIREALSRSTDESRQAAARNEARSRIDTLTPRELEILRWVISGALNKEIARSLGISEWTVKIHRGRVMQKTRVSSVAELIRLAELSGTRPAT